MINAQLTEPVKLMSPFAKGYKIPKEVGTFFKMTYEGIYKVRILTPAEQLVSYFTIFEEDYSDNQKRPKKTCIPDTGSGFQPENSKKTWALLVWNYLENCVQVWDITQLSIHNTLTTLAMSETKFDWTKYDIEIRRQGTDQKNTRYELIPADNSQLDLSIHLQSIHKIPNFDLTKMAYGQNPIIQSN